MPRYHICNFFGSRNKGDELMLRGTMALLGEGCAPVFTISSFGDPKADAIAIPGPIFLKALGGRANIGEFIWKTLFVILVCFRLNTLAKVLLSLFSGRDRPLIDSIKSADLVVVTGGPFLKENFRFGITTGNLAVPLIEPFLAVLFQKRLIILGQAFSKSYSFWGRSMMRRIIDYADVTTARDIASHRNANALRTNRLVANCPDLAFMALSPSHEERRRQIAVNVRLMDRAQLAALSRSTGRSTAEIQDFYIKQHSAGIQALLDKGEVTDLVFINQALRNDRIAAEKVVALLTFKGTCRIQEDGTPASELFREICRSDFAIMTRYHASLMALCSGTPFVSFAYDPKVAELLKAFDHEVNLISDLDSFIDQLLVAFQQRHIFKTFNIEVAQKSIVETIKLSQLSNK